MHIEELIKQRRSVYPAQFSGEKMDDEELIQYLDLANWAPNHLNTEPWRFKIFAEGAIETLMNKLSEIYLKITPVEKVSESKLEKYKYRAAKLSHVAAIVVEYDKKQRVPKIEETNAVACAVQNLWLAISATEDIRGYWSTGKLIYTSEFADFLGLNENQECLGLFYFGKLKKNAIKPQSTRRPIEEKMEWIR